MSPDGLRSGGAGGDVGGRAAVEDRHPFDPPHHHGVEGAGRRFRTKSGIEGSGRRAEPKVPDEERNRRFRTQCRNAARRSWRYVARRSRTPGDERCYVLLGRHRATQRHAPVPRPDEAALTAAIVECATQDRPVRLPADHGTAPGGRLASECQAGRADLARGRTHGAAATAQAGPALADRRVVPPAPTGAPEPRVGL